ncbi:MAG: hypothetical protein Kow0089_19390 [Desulfobulbaceae bacterium]
MTPSTSRPGFVQRLFFGAFFFCLLLVLLEFVAGLADLEKYDRLFMPKSAYPVFVPGEGGDADYFVTSSHFERFINKQRFLRAKPTGLTRIFIIGGSAAYGWPYPDPYSFSGYLRRALEKTAPGRFEIINVAGMSFGSHRVLDILRDVMLYDPDVVIVYSGNNEYVERNVLPETPPVSGPLTKVSGLLGNLDLYRAMRLAVYKVAPSVLEKKRKPDITDIRANPDVERGALGRSTEIDAEVLRNYTRNIIAMRDMLSAANVTGIFCTVPSNIGGWLPTVADPRFDSEQDLKRWLELLDMREKAFAAGNLALEEQIMRDILAITPDDAGMLFNHGKVLWNLGLRPESYDTLVRAKDLDLRPMRALSTFNRVINNLAGDRPTIRTADLESLFRDAYLEGKAESLFLDYCHFTIQGHKLVAHYLLRTLANTLRDIPVEDAENAIAADGAADSMDDYVRGHELYARAITLQNNRRFDEAIGAYEQVLELLGDFSAALSNLAHIYYQLNRFEESKKTYQRAVTANPRNREALLGLGFINKAENQLDKAEEYFQRAIRANPDAPNAYEALADIALERGNIPDAISLYSRSIELGGDNGDLRRNLGTAYERAGDLQRAAQNWKAALAFNPYDRQAREKLGQSAPTE